MARVGIVALLLLPPLELGCASLGSGGQGVLALIVWLFRLSDKP